ncbi:hypothetical protein [Actinoallomurus oryzae]|uniref:hypothetical protein n=1 Tax=Actinoallomurus oryzae TaxID=502180 RepID=UPI0031E6952D
MFVEHGARGADVFTGLDNPLTMTQVSWSSPPSEPSEGADLDTRLVRDVIIRGPKNHEFYGPEWHTSLKS